MEPKVKVTEKILECLLDSQEEMIDCHERNEIKTYLGNNEQSFIPFRLVKNAYNCVKKKGQKNIYLNEMLDGSDIYLPEYVPPPRNLELEERLKRLRAQQANRDYREMVRDIDVTEIKKPSNFGKEMKEMNTHMIAVFNFIVTVGGAFMFAYKATEYTLGSSPNVFAIVSIIMFAYKATEYTLGSSPNVFAIQLMNGLILGTVVFFADLYFLVKQTS